MQAKSMAGHFLLRGQNLSEVRQKELCAFRREHLGFVFQDFNLLDTLSNKDNIFLPMVLSGAQYDVLEDAAQYHFPYDVEVYFAQDSRSLEMVAEMVVVIN